MPSANVGMVCPFLGALCAFLGMLHSFLGMLYALAATLCEGEDAIHEELRGHHALHGVPDPFRERARECVGSSSERETMPPAYVGMPSGLAVSGGGQLGNVPEVSAWRREHLVRKDKSVDDGTQGLRNGRVTPAPQTRLPGAIGHVRVRRGPGWRLGQRLYGASTTAGETDAFGVILSGHARRALKVEEPHAFFAVILSEAKGPHCERGVLPPLRGFRMTVHEKLVS
jgi:hypothetical protein